MPTANRPAGDVARGVVVVLFGVAAVGAAAALFLTPGGRALLADPRPLAANVWAVVGRHPTPAAAAFLAAYVAVAVLCLPVWWLQMIGGVAFGLWAGGALSLAGSAIGAGVTAGLAEWFAGDWFRRRVEGRQARLRWVDEAMGHNGLLVVMAVRLTHVVPFGVSNVALGLSRVSTRDVLVGTLLGNVPAVAVYVGLGAGYRPLTNWRFDVAVGLANVVLMVPLAIRYLRPAWFRRVGLE